MPDIIKGYVDNVVEHYQPKNIDITLIQSFGKLELMIVDDGMHINGHLNNEETRLNTIMPKVMSHHGDASLETEQHKSYLLQVSLPLNAY
jgi:glucose-6-phosphate-specific signal transduction histidine kinase